MAIKKTAQKPEEIKSQDCCTVVKKSGGDIYGVGFVGAVIYFIQHAATFWGGVLGVLKALVWPALVVYKLLEFLKL